VSHVNIVLNSSTYHPRSFTVWQPHHSCIVSVTVLQIF